MTVNIVPPRFAIASLVIVGLAITMGFAVSTFLTRAVSEWESEQVSAVVRREFEDVDADALFQAAIGVEASARWQDVFAHVVRGVPDVVRCKAWNRDRVVLWSDETTLIGRQEENDPDLQAALAGRVVARVVEPARDDTNAAWRSQVLTRIYVPVVAEPGGVVQGVIELRKLPSRLSGTLRTSLFVVWAIALAGGVALWLVIRPLPRRRGTTVAAAPASVRTAAAISAEIRERFGFFPPFFEPALDSPAVLENLWQQTLSAYVNNPLPALFREKLFAYLSRYCAVPYCIVSHSCALRPLGMTAGDVLALLESPPRADIEIPVDLAVLAAAPHPLTEWPAPGAPLAEALINCAVLMFRNADEAGRAQSEMRRLLGANYSHLTEFLGYVKTCHFWVEAHPELAYEADQRAQTHLGALLAQEPRLAEFFRDYRRRVLLERQSAEQRRLDQLQTLAGDLASANEALRTEIREARERRDRPEPRG